MPTVQAAVYKKFEMSHQTSSQFGQPRWYNLYWLIDAHEMFVMRTKQAFDKLLQSPHCHSQSIRICTMKSQKYLIWFDKRRSEIVSGIRASLSVDIGKRRVVKGRVCANLQASKNSEYIKLATKRLPMFGCAAASTKNSSTHQILSERKKSTSRRRRKCALWEFYVHGWKYFGAMISVNPETLFVHALLALKEIGELRNALFALPVALLY